VLLGDDKMSLEDDYGMDEQGIASAAVEENRLSVNPVSVITPAPALVVPVNTVVSWQTTATNSLLNTNFYPEYSVKPFLDAWHENFNYILGPTNPAFIDAELSYQDIANGYVLEYNSNGILWRVNAAGVPHPDDLENYQEQLRVIESATDCMIKDFQSFDNPLQVIQDESKRIGDSSGNLAVLPGTGTTNVGDENYFPDSGIVNTGVSLKQAVQVGVANGILPNPATMESDYQFIEGGLGIGKFVGVSGGLMVDKKGNVYAILDGSVGYGLGLPVTGVVGQGYFGNAEKDDAQRYQKALQGVSFGTTTGAGVQGNVSIGTSGVISGEVSVNSSIGKTFGGRYVEYLFNINDKN
jgi:hypothetical protein